MESIRPIAAAVNLISSQPQYRQQINEDEVDSVDNVVTSNREKTDFPFIIVQGIFMVALVGFIGYCVVNGDIKRITVGYDNCGNVCGKLNDFTIEHGRSCEAEDMSNKSFLDVSSSTCVESCPPGSTPFGSRCLPAERISHDSVLNSIGRDFQICASEIVGLNFLALGFSFIILLVLRYLTAAFVWTVLFGVMFACAALTGLLWYLTEKTEALIPLAVTSSILTLILILVILVLRRRIELVIQLLKEAGKSITAVPLLILEPLLTCLALGIAAIAWVYFTLWIESTGTAEELYTDKVVFMKNGFIHFIRWYNLFMMLWMVQFIYGCQNMIIAGTVSRWYFTRNKSVLHNPILRSACDMFRYHLGTISFGSLLIALIQMLRIVLRSCRRFHKYLLVLCCLCCVSSYIEQCMSYVEGFLKYLTRNAYIVTSIYGTDFLKSGTKAFRLILDNVLQIAVINSVGDFVLVLSKLLVVIGTVLIALLVTQSNSHIQNQWAVLLLVAVVAYLIAHCFITVYEMAVDTIFICFCEDCDMNDGLARPYYMSHSLMEFVEKSRIVLNIKTEEGITNNAAVVVA
ncbi:hypothetical protein RI129_013081 [Pyrocoelia pectoralis]|uniref:Choline transporter-like protein n=1 Tax=Pyrocoelia pectoralis TaxID=417401 RepID=A0AAN7V476_9COLE